MNWYDLTARDVIKKLKSDRNTGLSSKEAQRRLHETGRNIIRESKSKPLFVKFLAQFSDFLIVILLVAATISAVTAFYEGSGDYVDSIIILVIVVVNAIIGVIQESKAEKAIKALKKLSSPHANVLRNGKIQSIDSDGLVAGDIIILKSGDFIPADARIIQANNLACDESALTGESHPSEKNAHISLRTGTTLAERVNMVFSSCFVTTGNAVCIVTSTGMDTQVGSIAKMIDKEHAPLTPLQKRLAQTGRYLGIAALAICAVIFVLGLVQGVKLMDMFMISVSLAVAAIPESLPAVVTIVLALGVRRLASSKAIIRHLPAVETLGSANVICSDKTGTLTQNKMEVVKICDESGTIRPNSRKAGEILELLSLCSNSTIRRVRGKAVVSGDPTESAFVRALLSRGVSKDKLDNDYPRIKEIPFDSGRKLMTTVHKLKDGRFRVITKGAPDILMDRCRGADKAKLAALNESMASSALRVLAVAFKDIDAHEQMSSTLERNLKFCALIGLIDPPRREVKDAVAICKQAQIKPVMITGDHVITASAIAKDLDIMQRGESALSGEQLERMSNEQLERNIKKYSVFARVTPKHKVRIVKAFRKSGAVVAMTGDGVNDAPALKAADIGCAMGRSGTDVAKGASDMILTDDNFSTIVKAIEGGRAIFDNIKKTVHFLISCNVGEILLVLIAYLFGMPTPILAIQLLWVNLVTDSLPALALGSEPMSKNIMKRPPIMRDASMFSGSLAYNIIVEGCFIGAVSVLAFNIGRFYDVSNDPIIGRTMAFAVLSISQLVHAFNVKSEYSMLKTNLLSNKKLVLSFFICLALEISVIMIPALSKIFKTSPLDLHQWAVVIGLSLSPILVVELEKLILGSMRKS